MTQDLQSSHLSELHQRAAELDISGYRLLPRAELIEKIGEKEKKKGRRRLRLPRRRGKQKQEEPQQQEQQQQAERKPQAQQKPRGEKKPAADEKTRPASGRLEIMPQRYGFLRTEGADEEEKDVYVSASQIRRCELRQGDLVGGPAREPRRGERHPALVRIELVNGVAPEEAEGRADFDSLTAIPPSRPLALTGLGGEVAGKLDELAFGQRVLIAGSPEATSAAIGDIASALPEGLATRLILVDARPEDATEWKRRASGLEVVSLTADLRPAEQGRMARLALAQAKRQAESGSDVVLLVDSLTRLGLAFRDPVDVKAFFGAGRDLEEEGAGSLTVIAALLTGTGVDTEEQVRSAVITTENLLVEL